MTNYEISSWSSLASNGSYDTGDIITLTGSFSTTNTSIVNLRGATLNGNGKTITFGSGRNRGLFQVDGATIKNLIIDGDNKTINQYEGFLVGNVNNSQWVNVIDCQLINANLSRHSGGFIGNSTQSSTQTTTFLRCYCSNVSMGDRFCGGYVGRHAHNIEITDSVADVSIGSSTECGGFIAYDCDGTNTISGSYAIIDNISSSGCGGLTSQIKGGSLTINQCYVLITGSFTGTYSGGLIGGMTSGVGNGVTITVNDSYLAGDVTGSNAGALVGYHAYGGTSGSENVIYLNRCYHAGSLTGRSVVGWHSNSNSYRRIEVTDCVVQSDNDNTGSAALVYSRTDTTNESINQDLPDGDDDGQTNENGFADNWSTGIWEASSNSEKPYPMLKTFKNLEVWDGSYQTYDGSSGTIVGGKGMYGWDWKMNSQVKTTSGNIPINNLTGGHVFVLSDDNTKPFLEMDDNEKIMDFPAGRVIFRNNGQDNQLDENSQFRINGKMVNVNDIIRPYFSIKY